MQKRKLYKVVITLLLLINLCGCETQAFSYLEAQETAYHEKPTLELVKPTLGNISLKDLFPNTAGLIDKGKDAIDKTTTAVISKPVELPDAALSITLSEIPAYSGKAYTTINNNIPFFSKSDITASTFENYGALDALGRCTSTFALVSKETMPKEARGEIGAVKPTGWHTVKYNGIDGNYLYNRCHLIAYCLTAENANPNNLITGTRYLNIEGMLPFEERVAKYLDKNTNNHVLYRATPMFDSNNLLATGVLIEAYSVEDSGAGICFCVFTYNVQPGVTINYKTGESSGPVYTGK